MTPDRARRNQTIILDRLASVGQVELAKALNTSESTISRWKAERLEECARALAALGLKVVPCTMKCFDSADIDALLQIARGRLQRMGNADELAWDDTD